MVEPRIEPAGHPPALGPREVFGVPVLPPAGVTRLVVRVRAGLVRVLRASGPPPVRILEGLFGVLDLAAIVALCRTGIPDRLTGRMEIGALASELGVDPGRLARLLRFSATRGWVRLDRRGRVRPTPMIAFLRADHPGGWRAWVEFMSGEEVLGAVGHVHVGMRVEGDPFAEAMGAPFFEWMKDHPDRHAVFDMAMAAGGRMHGLVLARSLDWSSSRRVCDVGGGTGALLATLLGEHPHLEGVLLELPEVAARAPSVARMTTVGGDAFHAVPAGCDTYLLVNVLHDWSDGDATRLLGAVATAMADHDSDGSGTSPRAIIIEGRTEMRPRDGFAAGVDLLMFTLTAGGRERTGAEFAALAAAAGLRLQRTESLPSGAVAHVLHPAGAG
jgi:hypothetical protein